MGEREKLEKRQALLKRQKILELKKRQVELVEKRTEATTRAEMSTMNKARGAIQSLNKGTMLGFGDEIVAAGRTAIEMLNPNSYGEGTQDFSDTYKMYRDDERDVTEDFEKGYGKTALALNVLGGVASPVNLVGGGIGGGSKAAASAVARRSVIEGGVAGLGESKADNLLDAAHDTLKGAGTGLAMSTGLRGLGKVGSKIAKRRVVEDLVDETGRRKPLHMTDSPISGLYRSIARMPGARQKLQTQENPFIDEAMEQVYKQEDSLTAAKAAADAAKRDASNILKIKQADDVLALTNSQKNMQGLGLDKAIQITDDINLNAENAARRAANAPAEIAEREAGRFRTTAARKALPDHAQEILDDVDVANDVGTVREKLARYWNKDAFQEVKTKQFPWGNRGDRKLLQDIRTRMADDPELALALDNALGKIKNSTKKIRGAGIGSKPRTAQELTDMLDSNIVGIDGDALMAIRNTFATGANGNSNNGWALREVANEFDDFIIANMDETSVTKFLQNKKQYTTALSYMDATMTKAARENAGLFTPSQWMSASRKYGGRGMSSRVPPMENTATAATKAISGGKQQAADATKAASRNARGLRKKAAQEKRKAANKLAERQRGETSQLNKAKAAEKRVIDDAAREESERLAGREVQGPLVEARRAVSSLKDKTLPRNVGPLSDYLMARQGGNILPGLSKAGPYQAAQGIGLGRMIASDSLQDALAGQADWQKKLAKAMREGSMDEVTRLLSRYGAMQATGE